MSFSSLFRRVTPLAALENSFRFKLKVSRTTGHSVNTHRSNRAKKGMILMGDV